MADKIYQDINGESIAAASTGDNSPINISVIKDRPAINSLLRPLLIKMVETVQSSFP